MPVEESQTIGNGGTVCHNSALRGLLNRIVEGSPGCQVRLGPQCLGTKLLSGDSDEVEVSALIPAADDFTFTGHGNGRMQISQAQL